MIATLCFGSLYYVLIQISDDNFFLPPQYVVIIVVSRQLTTVSECEISSNTLVQIFHIKLHLKNCATN